MSAVLPASSLNVSATPANIGAVSESASGVGGAIERLALSRELLRTAMLPSNKSTPHALGAGVGGVATSVFERIKELPGASVLLDALREWWAHHPLRTAGVVAAEASRKLAGPVAQRNPIGLVLCAVIAGALFALSRPWRWLLRPALFAGLVPAVASRAVRELPVDAWMKVLASLSTPSKRASARPAAELEPAPYS